MENLNDVIWNDEDNTAESYFFGDPNIKGPYICMSVMCSQMTSEYPCKGPIATFTDVCLGFPT